MTELFAGVIVVALVGNAAEHYSAVTAARNNEMTLALEISVGSSAQIALMVAPVLVLLVVRARRADVARLQRVRDRRDRAVGSAVALVSLDGESNWLEGLQLLGVYVILALAFYMVPGLARSRDLAHLSPGHSFHRTLQRVIRAPSAVQLVGHFLDLIRTTRTPIAAEIGWHSHC